jgi:putative photosynthetic complex assembly protein
VNTTAQNKDSFPRWFLLSAGALIAFSLVSVAIVRITGNGPDQRAARGLGASAPGLQRPLRFEDRADGSIVVVDGRTGELVAQIEGQQGFVRGALAHAARERQMCGLGPQAPFQLQAHPDGALVLLDPQTGERINLASFGPTNAGAFAQLLRSTPDTPASALSAPAR